MELFSIQCPTCSTRLKVRSEAAIGQILSCPKCQSMVEVKPPPGWKPTKPEPAPQAAQPAEPAPAEAQAPTGETWSQPFGFEKAPRPAWQTWGAIVAAAAVAFVLGLTLWPAPDPALTQNTDPSADGTKEAPPVDPVGELPKKPDPEKTPETDPTKTVDPPTKAVDPPTKSVDPPTKTVDPPTKSVDPPTKSVDVPPPVKPEVPEPKKVDPPVDPVKPPVKPVIEPIKPEPRDPNPGIPLAEVESRLGTAIELIQSPPKLMLSDAIDALAQIANLKITLDVEALAQAGVAADDPVAFDMAKCTVSDVLDRVLEQRGLVYLIEAGQLRVTTRREERDAVRERSHDVADLTKGDAAAAKHLAVLIEKVVEPGSWAQRPVQASDQKLLVTHNEWAQRRIALLLARLRMARGLTARAPAVVDQALASRVSRATAKLTRPLTVNIADTPLTRAATTLSARAECKILIDLLALDAAGITPESRATVQTKQAQPLEQILSAMLTPLELTYRVIDEKTLQITSRQAASETVDLELYRAGDLAATPALAAALIERIEREVAPGTWYAPPVAGAERPKVQGGLAYDPASGYLVVAHVQSVQALVEDLLDTIRRPAQPAPDPAKK